jgi:hypothetical protein
MVAKDAEETLNPFRRWSRLDIWLGGVALSVLVCWYVALLLWFPWTLVAILPAGIALFVLAPASLLLMSLALAKFWLWSEAWERELRIGLICGLLAALTFTFGTPGGLLKPGLADRAVQREFERSIGLVSLQQWAMEILQKPNGLRPSRSDLLPRGVLPDSLRPLAVAVWLERGASPDDDYVHIAIGGGFHHYGVLVGAPGFRPADTPHYWTRRWRDGIYGYQE